MVFGQTLENPPKTFVYGHIPRTGGDALGILFKLLAGLQPMMSIRSDSLDLHMKHDRFQDREVVEEWVKILSIRRLPNWMMSWIIMMSGGLDPKVGRFINNPGIYPKHDSPPLPIPTIDQMLGRDEYGKDPEHQWVTESYGPLHLLPDHYLNEFLDGGSLTVQHFIRTDSLIRDFCATAFKLGVPESSHKKLEKKCGLILSMIKKQPIHYNRDPLALFTKDELDVLYANNPLWADYERKVYGGVYGA